MRTSDAEYFSRRCREERAVAEATSDPRIASLHKDMAVLYEAAAKLAESAALASNVRQMPLRSQRASA